MTIEEKELSTSLVQVCMDERPSANGREIL
jgi:DNA replication initiation complex subunit (GINS family)